MRAKPAAAGAYQVSVESNSPAVWSAATRVWCREGDSNPHALFKAADFKSAASASSAIPAQSQPFHFIETGSGGHIAVSRKQYRMLARADVECVNATQANV